MKEKKDIQKTNAEAVNAKTGAEGARPAEVTFIPDVDIREDSENMYLEADMAGVDAGSVDISVDNGVLSIEGRARVEVPQGYELAGQEYGVGKYRRDFTLSDAVDADGIKARMRNGVLDVTLPKHRKAKTRKIDIES